MSLSATPINTGKGNTGSVNTNTSLVLTVTAPTAGNWVTLVVCTNSAAQVRVTQTNVTWSAISYTQNGSSGTKGLWVFRGRVFASAGTSVTIALTTAAAFTGAAVYAEWSGVNIRLDQIANATGSSASPASGATGTTDTGAELIIGGFGIAGQWSGATTIFSSPVQTGTATGGTVSIVDQDNTTINSGASADRAVAMTVQLLSSTGTVNVGTTITSAQWTAGVATFEETSAGGASPIGLGSPVIRAAT